MGKKLSSSRRFETRFVAGNHDDLADTLNSDRVGIENYLLENIVGVYGGYTLVFLRRSEDEIARRRVQKRRATLAAKRSAKGK